MLEQTLETIDAEFRAATEPDTDHLLAKYFRADHLDGAWWRQRVPKRGPIGEYLKRA